LTSFWDRRFWERILARCISEGLVETLPLLLVDGAKDPAKVMKGWWSFSKPFFSVKQGTNLGEQALLNRVIKLRPIQFNDVTCTFSVCPKRFPQWTRRTVNMSNYPCDFQSPWRVSAARKYKCFVGITCP
jgi:hypothetical protein